MSVTVGITLWLTAADHLRSAKGATAAAQSCPGSLQAERPLRSTEGTRMSSNGCPTPLRHLRRMADLRYIYITAGRHNFFRLSDARASGCVHYAAPSVVSDRARIAVFRGDLLGLAVYSGSS